MITEQEKIMNRLIKFRLWDTQATNDSVTRKRPKMLQPREVDSHVIWSLNEEPNTHEPQTRYEVMQFTGLLDKNGVEIYEGDILAHEAYGKDRRWVVEWLVDGEYVGFIKRAYVHGVADAHKPFMSFDGCEILGNIYEDPEQLEQRK